MAKGREKQRAHAASSITKEERLAMEAAQREAEEVARKEAEEAARKEAEEEETSLYDFCGLKDPTPYRAFKNIDRRNRDTARVIRKRAVASI